MFLYSNMFIKDILICHYVSMWQLTLILATTSSFYHFEFCTHQDQTQHWFTFPPTEQSSEMASLSPSVGSPLSDQESQSDENICDKQVIPTEHPTPSPHQRKNLNPRKISLNAKRNPPKSAIHEIKYLQNKHKGHIIPRLPFARLVREILIRFGASEFRIQLKALEALQEASEMYLTQLLEDAYRCTLHRQRQTLLPIDVQLVRIVRGISDLGNH